MKVINCLTVSKITTSVKVGVDLNGIRKYLSNITKSAIALD